MYKCYTKRFIIVRSYFRYSFSNLEEAKSSYQHMFKNNLLPRYAKSSGYICPVPTKKKFH